MSSSETIPVRAEAGCSMSLIPRTRRYYTSDSDIWHLCPVGARSARRFTPPRDPCRSATCCRIVPTGVFLEPFEIFSNGWQIHLLSKCAIEPDRGKLVSIDRLRDCADSQPEQQGVVK